MKPNFHSPIFTACLFYHVLIFTEFNDVTDSQIMLFYGISDVIAVCSFRIMKQWRADEILMFIDELSKWAITSFVPSIFDSLFYEVIPRLSAVHFILSDRFRQFYLQNEAACWIFLIHSNEN